MLVPEKQGGGVPAPGAVHLQRFAQDNDDTDHVPVIPSKESAPIAANSKNDDADHNIHKEDRAPPYPARLALSLGLLSASPALLLIRFGAKTPFASIFIYIGFLLGMSVCAQYGIKSGVMRWILGIVFLGMTAAFKSAHLLASCNNVVVKGILYAITALWECSNAVLIVGGEDLFRRYNIRRDAPRDIILQALAPCQVKFVHDESSPRYICSSPGKTGRRSVHIALCSLGVATMYFILVDLQPVQTAVTSLILVELKCLAFMTSMAVILLDIPSHLWQVIHDVLALTPLFTPDSFHSSAPKVILPYGWVYSSTSTREFWSNWSRPATQLIRHLLYHPLGGRSRWYISIPTMFLLNASSHFDLSYALVGDKAEVYWIAIFGTLCIVALLEVAGDIFFAGVNVDGNVSFPSWYKFARALLAHAALLFALYVMIHKCLHSSLSKLLESEADADS